MRPLRNPVIQAVLAWTLASWMRFCFATIRWTHVNQPAPEAIWKRGGGVLCAFWHSRIALSPACWPLDRATPAKALISLSLWLTVSWAAEPYYYGNDLPYLMAWTPLILAGAPLLSVDAALRARRRRGTF